MSSPGENPQTLTEEMLLSAQTGDLTKLQSRLVRWETEVADKSVMHSLNTNDPIMENFCPALGFVTYNEARVSWCLQHGAIPNARNKNKYQDVPSQAGHYASVSTFQLLAADGANFPCSNVLQRAAESRYKGRMEALQWLLDEAGFPINQHEFEWDPATFRNWRGNVLGTALH
ncbi:ankyrin [Aspergillus affinis]|uniref:ankyrin n=1 Tax=Aspergillus affinis TaxID=1070780 RepID=UPI0022FE0DB4|nr:ankyrin [Aspergillus affinis]KAI9037434.1 ankyrin [Aspergillus affinis]